MAERARGGVAYLASRYPAISHSFIAREVRALRKLGLRVETFGIHRSDPRHVLTSGDAEALRDTYAVLPPHWPSFFRAHLREMVTRPLRYLATLRLALSQPPAGRKGRVSDLAHFVEAVLVWHECRRRGLRHVHAHFTRPSADVALLASHLAGGELSWSFTAHGVDIPLDSPDRLAEKVRRAAWVACVSEFGRRQVMGLVEARYRTKVHLIRCGVDPDEFAPRPGRAGEGGVLRILTVGRAEPVKAHAVLLEAVALLAERGIDAGATVVGDGSLLPALRRRAAGLGLDGRVRFAGTISQDRIRDYYAAADVFCLPSLGEGVPVVLMEAMAMELPVVASRVMGVPELVEDGVSGLLVPPARPDLLADALERLATDRGLRERMGAAGRTAVKRRFDPGVAAGLLRDLLVTSLNGSAGSRKVAAP
jgi:colanic acid/amylovoran biosynthesis glycosyltransferase